MRKKKSGLLSQEELEAFTQQAKSVKCGLCGNHCQLTVNTFPGGRRFISGNRCDRPITHRTGDDPLNLYAYKLSLLEQYGEGEGTRGTVGMPMCLSFYELFPFWHTLFTKLGFRVRRSAFSTRATYLAGQATIPSDTVCYPAKLAHGHVKELAEMPDVDAIFYPLHELQLQRGAGRQPLQLPGGGLLPGGAGRELPPELEGKTFIYDFAGPHNRRAFPKKMAAVLRRYWPDITLAEVEAAAAAAYEAYAAHMAAVRRRGAEIIAEARAGPGGALLFWRAAPIMQTRRSTTALTSSSARTGPP